MKVSKPLIQFALFLFIFLCGCAVKDAKVETLSEVSSTPILSPEIESNVFDQFLKSDYLPADGFDFPVGNADGKGSSQNVFATANGRIVFAENCGVSAGNVIIIEHDFYENNEKRSIRSVYTRLQEIKIKNDEAVRRRQVIANVRRDSEKSNPPQFYFELDWNRDLPLTCPASANGENQERVRNNYAPATEFINSHRKLFAPQQEPTLILVDRKSYKMRLYKSGNLQGEYEVSFGQSKGTKRVQGDNKTPAGMYFIVQKHRGKFEGTYGGYYGGHWIKINYPNKYDAERGLSEGIINAGESAAIKTNWSNRESTLENTKLGGGIGFHGWISEWDNAGTRHLSWGCVVMHIYDISRLFDEMTPGTMVVIF